MRPLLIAASLLLLTTAGALAQPGPKRIRGSIQKLDGNTLTVVTTAGDTDTDRAGAQLHGERDRADDAGQGEARLEDRHRRLRAADAAARGRDLDLPGQARPSTSAVPLGLGSRTA